MKRKLKITGLALVLVTVVSVLVNSAVSGSVGFGIALILCFFLACIALVGLFLVTLRIYILLKKHLDVYDIISFSKSDLDQKPAKSKQKQKKPLPVEEPDEERSSDDDL